MCLFECVYTYVCLHVCIYVHITSLSECAHVQVVHAFFPLWLVNGPGWRLHVAENGAPPGGGGYLGVSSSSGGGSDGSGGIYRSSGIGLQDQEVALSL